MHIQNYQPQITYRNWPAEYYNNWPCQWNLCKMWQYRWIPLHYDRFGLVYDV